MNARLALFTSDLTPRACVIIDREKAYRMNPTSTGSLARLRSSFRPSQQMLERRFMLSLLPWQARDTQSDENRYERGQGERVRQETIGSQAFGKGANTCVHVIRGRPKSAKHPGSAIQGGDRLEQTRELRCWQDCEDRCD